MDAAFIALFAKVRIRVVFLQLKLNQLTMAIAHESTIELTVGLDENRVPETLNWSANDGGVDGEEAKALLW